MTHCDALLAAGEQRDVSLAGEEGRDSQLVEGEEGRDSQLVATKEDTQHSRDRVEHRQARDSSTFFLFFLARVTPPLLVAHAAHAAACATKQRRSHVLHAADACATRRDSSSVRLLQRLRALQTAPETQSVADACATAPETQSA